MQKKHIKKMDIIFWSGMFIISILELIFQVDYEIVLNFSIGEFFNFLIEFSIALLGTFFINIFELYFVTIAYFSIRIVSTKKVKGRFEKIDFKNDNYYRDILPQYSPSVLSFLDNFKLDKCDIVATLLNLELKEKIKIDEDIYVIDESDIGLLENEKYVLDNIKRKNINNIDLKEYEEIVIEDCKRYNLIEKQKFTVDDIKKRMLIIEFIIIAVVVLNAILSHFFKGTIIIMGIILFITFLIIIPYFLLSKVVRLVAGNIRIYNRTKAGKEINAKMEGLKKFLLDYSKIETREKEEIILWQDYLVYAVMFGINNEIVKEIYEKLNK